MAPSSDYACQFAEITGIASFRDIKQSVKNFFRFLQISLDHLQLRNVIDCFFAQSVTSGNFTRIHIQLSSNLGHKPPKQTIYRPMWKKA